MQDKKTILGTDVKFKGDIVAKNEDIELHGFIYGSIETTDKILGKSTARIEADLSSSELILDGHLQGNVQALRKIDINKGAKLIGDIDTAELSIDSGALFRGNCQMRSPKEAPPPK